MTPLAKISLPTGSKGTQGLPHTKQKLINCFFAGDKIIQRPGITELNTNTRVARGGFEWNGALYEVASTDLLKIDTSDGTYTVVGTIDGSAQIDIAIGFNHVVIVVKGGKGYTLDKSDTLTEITNINYVASNAVTHMNGRFVYIPSSGDPAFFSDIGDGSSIQAGSFFDAEELPDKNIFCINLRNILLIGGTDSFEQFRDLGQSSVPFRRLNARIDYGYISAGIEYMNTLCFIGREKNQNLGIYTFGQGQAEKISNEYIDTILDTYTQAELEMCIPNRLKWRGYDLMTFTLARHSFGYYGGNWFDLDTYENGEPDIWQAGYIVEFETDYYTFYADKIGRFAAVNRDYGTPFRRLINIGFETDGNFTAQSLQYNISQGYNTADGSVFLEMSDDNILFGPAFAAATADQGRYSDKLVWDFPGGLGFYDTYAAFNLWTAEDIDFSGTSIDIDMR